MSRPMSNATVWPPGEIQDRTVALADVDEV